MSNPNFLPPAPDTIATPQQLAELAINSGVIPISGMLALQESVITVPLSNVDMAPLSSTEVFSTLAPFTMSGQPVNGYRSSSPEVTDTLFRRESANGSKEWFNTVPSELDKAPEGTHIVMQEKEGIGFSSFNIEPKVARTVRVLSTPLGNVIGSEAFKARNMVVEVNPGTEKMMRGIGYTVNKEGTITGVPAPETLKASAKALGVDVALMNEEKVDGATYLAVFSEGKYPVSVSSENYYLHDIADDHLTTMVLGGDELRDALKAAAGRALKTSDENIIKDTTSDIDGFTNTLGGILYLRMRQMHRGYDGLVEAGEKMGIPKEAVDSLVATVRKRAIEFGITLRPEA